MNDDDAPKTALDLCSIEEIGIATRMHLESSGFKSLKDLVVRGPVDISEATGMDIEKSAILCNRARQRLEDAGVLEKNFVTARKLYNKRLTAERTSTGSRNLDTLLGGGLETRAVTEIYGEYGTGKTQICHNLCVMVSQDRAHGGLGGKAIYVDTENTFRPERIVSICNARNIEPDHVLDTIIVAKAYNSAHQELIIDETGPIIDANGVKLVIVDSAVAHYRAEFLGRATLSERQQKLNKFMHILLRISETYDVAIIITNQIQSSPDSIFGDTFKPTGGNVVAHTSTYRIYLKRSGRNRIARMVDSPCHPETEVLFTLSDKGATDPDQD
ncbi:MAG: DNA repair and recombination protein RadA [Nitrososphaeraceae archaeon]